MAVKTSTSQIFKEKFSYPKLMISDNGCIVLMNKPNEGTCIVRGNTSNLVGNHYTGWIMSNFEDYAGTVTLENE